MIGPSAENVLVVCCATVAGQSGPFLGDVSTHKNTSNTAGVFVYENCFA